MTTAVEAVFVGKERRFNRRFLAMCSHYLVEPSVHAGGGLGKGPGREPGRQCARATVHPRLHFANYAELNAWLEARCLAQARESAHPEQRDRRCGRCSRPSRPA